MKNLFLILLCFLAFTVVTDTADAACTPTAYGAGTHSNIVACDGDTITATATFDGTYGTIDKASDGCTGDCQVTVVGNFSILWNGVTTWTSNGTDDDSRTWYEGNIEKKSGVGSAADLFFRDIAGTVNVDWMGVRFLDRVHSQPDFGGNNRIYHFSNWHFNTVGGAFVFETSGNSALQTVDNLLIESSSIAITSGAGDAGSKVTITDQYILDSSSNWISGGGVATGIKIERFVVLGIGYGIYQITAGGNPLELKNGIAGNISHANGFLFIDGDATGDAIYFTQSANSSNTKAIINSNNDETQDFNYCIFDGMGSPANAFVCSNGGDLSIVNSYIAGWLGAASSNIDSSTVTCAGACGAGDVSSNDPIQWTLNTCDFGSSVTSPQADKTFLLDIENIVEGALDQTSQVVTFDSAIPSAGLGLPGIGVCEYGTTSLTYTNRTPYPDFIAGSPTHEKYYFSQQKTSTLWENSKITGNSVTMLGLTPNTPYFYRCGKLIGGGRIMWQTAGEGTFTTIEAADGDGVLTNIRSFLGFGK